MTKIYSCLIALLLFNLSLTKEAKGQIALDSTTIDTSTLVSGLSVPWEILWGPDNFIWMTERNGVVSRVNPETGEKIELLTIDVVIEESESGLLGMALHPDFSNTPEVFLAYTHTLNGFKERLVKYTYNGSALVNEQILIDDIPAHTNHDGSRLIISPDNKLLMTTGDALNTSLPQDKNSLNGKVLRINLDGSIPTDNPDPSSYVYTIGHRNAQGLVYANGKLYSSEHGPTSDDELNIIEADRNYGWPLVQGYCDKPIEQSYCDDLNVKEATLAWTPTLAVAGIDYYNHPAIPEWSNSILLTTLKEDDFRILHLGVDGSVTEEEVFFNNWFGRLRDVCVSPDGAIYIATSNRDGRANDGFPLPQDDRIIKIANPYPLSTDNVNREVFNVSLYPNPAKSTIAINLTGASNTWNYKLVDNLGKVILTGSADSNKHILDISTLTSGVYYMVITCGDLVRREKILIAI